MLMEAERGEGALSVSSRPPPPRCACDSCSTTSVCCACTQGAFEIEIIFWLTHTHTNKHTHTNAQRLDVISRFQTWPREDVHRILRRLKDIFRRGRNFTYNFRHWDHVFIPEKLSRKSEASHSFPHSSPTECGCLKAIGVVLLSAAQKQALCELCCFGASWYIYPPTFYLSN